MPLLIILKLLADVESLSKDSGLLLITVWFAYANVYREESDEKPLIA